MTDKSFIKNVLSQFPGRMVTVNNHKMHVYTEGKGIVTLVFMSGSGTCSPVYDFKTLFSRMSDECQIAVVEKAGYGFSEITNMPRDIDTMLFETRTALKEANINPPYTLFPHSMSAIEAFYWVQCYPDEIKAIIGLDPALPIHYEVWDIDYSLKRMKFFSKLLNKKFKLLRPIVANSLPPLKYGILTKPDKKACKAISKYRILTNDMINETLMVKENAKKIDAEALKTAPMLFFISNGKEVGMKEGEWEKSINNYTKELNVKIVPLNAGHYLHDILPGEIANNSKKFIKDILNRSLA
jgi:pimeloyl-ACP methyl ester carboxylesterase